MSDPDLSDPAGTVEGMDEHVDLLMLTSVVHPCPDCQGDRVFVAVDAETTFEYACTDCGAAVVIDPVVEVTVARRAGRNVA